MDVIISANEKILAMMQSSETRLSRDMTEEDYIKWINKIIKTGAGDEKEV